MESDHPQDKPNIQRLVYCPNIYIYNVITMYIIIAQLYIYIYIAQLLYIYNYYIMLYNHNIIITINKATF